MLQCAVRKSVAGSLRRCTRCLIKASAELHKLTHDSQHHPADSENLATVTSKRWRSAIRHRIKAPSKHAIAQEHDIALNTSPRVDNLQIGSPY